MTAGYIQINLASLLDDLGEDRAKSIFSDCAIVKKSFVFKNFPKTND